MFLSLAARCHTDHDMAAALRRFFTRRGRPVAEPVTCSCACTNPDEEQFNFPNFPEVLRDEALRGEFELPTAGDVDHEWLLFSYT